MPTQDTRVEWRNDRPVDADPALSSLIAGGCSLEMTAKDVSKLQDAQNVIRPGSQISVTFLPGETFEARTAAAKEVKRLGFVPVPHISARRLTSSEELEGFLAQLASEVGIERAFVVAGDPPEPMGPYDDALSIIKSGLLAKYGVRQVGISGYPDGHPDIPEPVLWQAMTDKCQVLADLGHSCEITTQFGFDAEPVLDWLKRLRDRGIEAPVRIGIAGPATVKTLLRFAARCGVGASTKVMSKYGMSITKLLQKTGPDKLVDEFAASLDPAQHGDVFLHFYPFGGLKKTAEWEQSYRSSGAGMRRNQVTRKPVLVSESRRKPLAETPLFDRDSSIKGYKMNKMAMALGKPENREAFKRDEEAFIDSYGLSAEAKKAVMARDWHEMVRLGGNLFFILKITAIDPVPITAVGAAQAGMDHDRFLTERLGKKING